ncbi:MAG TPA: hypothetical protein VFI60_05655 [Candidatus Acidoferrum sp.]|nr:hypothetical protein [Candidatus Acidoferrum sp.]
MPALVEEFIFYMARGCSAAFDAVAGGDHRDFHIAADEDEVQIEESEKIQYAEDDT